MKWIAVVALTLLLLLGTLAGVRSMRSGGSFWINTRVTRTASHEGVGDKIKALTPGKTTSAEAEAALGKADGRTSSGDVEEWRYEERVSEVNERRLLGFLRVGGGSHSSMTQHSITFHQGLLVQRTGHGDPEPEWRVAWKAGKLSRLSQDRHLAAIYDNPAYDRRLKDVEAIRTAETTVGELDARFGSPAETFRRGDLEIRQYRVKIPERTAGPGEAIASAGEMSHEFLVVIKDGVVIDAPYDRSAPDELIERFRDFRSWDRK